MRKRAIVLSMFIIAATALYALRHTTIGYYDVVEVFDGDTIAVNMRGAVEKIRMIGVDTPETKDPRKPVQCYGERASNYTHATLSRAKVRLQADPLSTNRDRYDRLLRYVYLPDGTLYNAALLRQGYARAYTGFPFTKSSEFQTIAATAQHESRGLWQQCSSATEADVNAGINEQ